MPGRVYRREFKLQVVKAVENGDKRSAQACREYEIDSSLLTRWRREYKERGEAAFESGRGGRERSEAQQHERRIDELERLCGQLALENSALKKLLATSRSTSVSR